MTETVHKTQLICGQPSLESVLSTQNNYYMNFSQKKVTEPITKYLP